MACLEEGQSPDIQGGVLVRVRTMPARYAEELLLALPVGFVDASALVARPGRVAGVHLDDGYARELRLVGQKREQLEERPAGKLIASVSAPNREPVADTAEVFNGNPATGVFSSGDDRLADAVILMAAESGFLIADPRQLLFRAFGVSFLEALPLEVVLATDRLDGFSRIGVAIAVGRNLGDAQVHPEEVFNLDRSVFWSLDRGVEVELSISAD